MAWWPPEPLPIDLLSPQPVRSDPGHAVELVYRDDELFGTAGGMAVSLALPRLVWKERATLAGSADGRPVLVDWRMVHVGARGGSDGYAAAVRGRMNGEDLAISAALHFDPSGHPVSRAAIIGELCGQGVQAQVVPIEPDGTSSYYITGGLYDASGRVRPRDAMWGGPSSRPFAFYIKLDRGSQALVLRGHTSDGVASVDGTGDPAAPRQVRLTGLFEGPTPILLLLVGSAVQWVR